MKQRNIGIIDVDSHNFPNFALMRVSAYYKSKGYDAEQAVPSKRYDIVAASKIFTFTPDYDYTGIEAGIMLKGGTGYDVGARLPKEIEESAGMDYALYPQYPFSVQFFSRGCIRRCPFCLVREKEGYIAPVTPVNLNPNGKHIEVLDNNFFANPAWKEAVDYLLNAKQKVNLHGVDIRIMNEEQAYWLNRLPLHKSIHIAWDLPQIDLTDKLREVTKYIKPYKLMCYVLVGYDSTIEQDMYRIERLRELGIKPFVMPYRDFDNARVPTQYEKDLAQYVNKPMVFKSCTFADFSPRKGFKCGYYLTNNSKTVC